MQQREQTGKAAGAWDCAEGQGGTCRASEGKTLRTDSNG